MDIRDQLNKKEKYIENIEFDAKCVLRDFDEYEQENQNWDSDRIFEQFSIILMRSKQVLISKYSLGLPVSDLVEDYKQCVLFMAKGWKAESGYVEMVWMLSIGIMLEIDQGYFDKLVSLVERDSLQEYLVDFLINYRKPTWGKQSNDFQFPIPYKATKEIVSLSKTDKQAAIQRLHKYLQKEWYSGHKGSGWHDDHKSKWGVHSGYWCFESGALVKILGLDDTSLKDQQYYPYDMVHWKD